MSDSKHASEAINDAEWPAAPQRIANRYAIGGLLGRGGMGSVYRVHDSATGDACALKRLETTRGSSVELFEREYHTLKQLAHPRVVRALDYGIDAGKPYYTMELLDGGDLRQHVPIPWKRACAIAYEVCSVLALLHSRELVHRDISPRNIQLTSDGKAKLIDFGLLSPMGPSQIAVGTPPYVAPEVINGSSLDGRSDLFSLGCTLYYALTKVTAFPAKRLADLQTAWRHTPARVSVFAPEVPAALERLLVELMRMDMDSRPRSAAEVMDRLRPLLAEAPDELLTVAQAHLSAPALVARKVERVSVRRQVMRAARGRGGGLLIKGAPGTGRSRVLDLFSVEARLLGGIAARAGAGEAAAGPFGAANAWLQQIAEQAGSQAFTEWAETPGVLATLFEEGEDGPGLRLRDLTRLRIPHATLQALLRDLLLAISKKRLVAIALDDFEGVDEASGALLAALALESPESHFAYAVTSVEDPLETPAMKALAECARPLPLSPLSSADTLQLLRTVFGDVANLQATNETLYRLSGGRPRECMQLAQHLVDAGTIAYESGTWRLPERIETGGLPQSMEARLAAEVQQLSPLALKIAEALALCIGAHLSRSQLIDLLDADAVDCDFATDELRRTRLLAGGPSGYTLDRGAKELLARTDPGRLATLHDRLSALYAKARAPQIVIAHHGLRGLDPEGYVRKLLSGWRDAAAGERTSRALDMGIEAIGANATAEVILLADQLAARADLEIGRRFVLWQMLGGLVPRGADPEYFRRVPNQWLPILKRDSGLDDWLELERITDPAARAQEAVRRAGERYERLPEQQRVLPPREAMKGLLSYVVIGFSAATRYCDLELFASLPSLLAPFAPLERVAGAMRRAESAVMTRKGFFENSLQIARDQGATIDALPPAEASAMSKVRAEVWLHQRLLEILLGVDIESHEEQKLATPTHRAYAAQLERWAALYRGAWGEAERHRKRAELIALQHGVTAVFTSLASELLVQADIGNLAGLRSVRERLQRRATVERCWLPFKLLSDVYYHELRGEAPRALRAVELLREYELSTTVRSPSLLSATRVEVELLTAAGQPRQARERAKQVLATFYPGEPPPQAMRSLSCGLALADAALGDFAQARRRIEKVIERHRQLGVSGLLRGIPYEYLARVALQEGDREAFDAAALAVKNAYRLDTQSLLAGRYRRLFEEAELAGFSAQRASLGYDDGDGAAPSAVQLSQLTSLGTTDSLELPQEGLSLLCQASGAGANGWLYLLTQDGLVLSAATRAPDDAEALAALAQSCLDLELNDNACTQAAQGLTQDEAAETGASGDNPPGRDKLQALPLSAAHEGRVQVVGVAFLTGEHAYELGPLAHELAKHLIASGTYHPKEAA